MGTYVKDKLLCTNPHATVDLDRQYTEAAGPWTSLRRSHRTECAVFTVRADILSDRQNIAVFNRYTPIEHQPASSVTEIQCLL
jgi:hypothetical protein